MLPKCSLYVSRNILVISDGERTYWCEIHRVLFTFNSRKDSIDREQTGLKLFRKISEDLKHVQSTFAFVVFNNMNSKSFDDLLSNRKKSYSKFAFEWKRILSYAESTRTVISKCRSIFKPWNTIWVRPITACNINYAKNIRYSDL